MTVPICPNHPQGPKPMQMGKFGKWFCPNKNPDGSWCKGAAQVAPPGAVMTVPGGPSTVWTQPAPQSPPAAPPVAVQEQNGHDYAPLAVASLGLAQALYGGFLDPKNESDITNAAMRIFSAMKVLCR